ncbi:MAG: DNA/RNA non-specific endonuclease [Clostridia bacterium]|nr:DNA/RNA non-specific endonuclease [Clostridia bacterium]
MKKRSFAVAALLIALSISLSGCAFLDTLLGGLVEGPPLASLDSIPEFTGKHPYAVINGNVPFFTDEERDTSYEKYSRLDSLGRCGPAIACIGTDIMPTEDRESISHIKPSGWQSSKYDIVDGKYLYNRAHLIGFQLTGENGNEKNLITGTRYMNVKGMLPFENMVADYVKETENRVLYRVTPIFDGNDLVARGVLMEAASVEDDEIRFCVYVYNAQPGITIDYATGNSRLSSDPVPDEPTPEPPTKTEYVLNTSTKKFHLPSCTYAVNMTAANKESYVGERDALIGMGYSPCGKCNP